MIVNIKCTNGDKFVVTTESSAMISEFKKLLETQSTIPIGQQRLIYKGNESKV